MMSRILGTTTLPELRAVLREDRWDNLGCRLEFAKLLAPDRIMAPGELDHVFQLCEAIWYYKMPHSPSPDRPHVELRNKNHSNFFVNCMEAEKESTILSVLAYQAAVQCADYASQMCEDDWVIGAERAGAPIAQAIAHILGCRHATVEKDSEGNPTVFTRFEIGEGQRVLLVNDLLSHRDGSTYMSKVAVAEACPGAEIFPVAMHLVNRSGARELIDGTPVRALLEFHPQEYAPDECPLCKGGSPALKLKPNRALFFAPKLAA